MDGDAWIKADPTLCPVCGRESCEDHLPPESSPPPAAPLPSEATYADRLGREIDKERVRRDARRFLDAEERPPVPIPVGERLRDRLARPIPARVWRIEGWQPQNSRVLLTAQYKSGKTVVRDNWIRSVVDGDPFLGVAKAIPITGTAVVIDLEMQPTQLDAWLRCQCIRDDDRIVVYSLRQAAGSFNLLDERIRAQWAARLRDDGAEALALDCVRPVLDALGLDEHRDAGRFLVAFDRLLAEAEITDSLTIQHMGHNNERARGDSRFSDWPDVEWKLVRKDESPSSARFISAYGRDVDVSENALAYNSLTRALTLAGGSRAAVKRQEALDAIVVTITDAKEPLSGREIESRLSGMIPRDDVRTGLPLGVQSHILAVEEGPRNAKLYKVVGV